MPQIHKRVRSGASNNKLNRPVTIMDVAAAAKVSLATADRALNDRPGVAKKTADRVQAAAKRLGWSPNALAQSLSRRTMVSMHVLLPAGDNPFLLELARCVQSVSTDFLAHRIIAHVERLPERDPAKLAAHLLDLRRHSSGVALLGLQHPSVVAAINALINRGTPVVTLVADVQGSKRNVYVGIDNRAAGRTAGILMGRFLGDRGGLVAVFAGDLLYADLLQREVGFTETLRARFPAIGLLPSIWDVEDDGHSYRAAQACLAAHRDLSGIYVAGGGISGVARALREAGRWKDVTLICHDLVGEVPSLLRAGIVDAAINQDPRTQVQRALQVLTRLSLRSSLRQSLEHTDIQVYIAENLPAGV